MKIQSNYSVTPNKKVGFNSRNIILKGTEFIQPDDIIRMYRDHSHNPHFPTPDYTVIEYIQPRNEKIPVQISDPESIVVGEKYRVKKYETTVQRVFEQIIKLTKEELIEFLKKARMNENEYFNLD
jgi:hypothetical protein